MCVFCLALFFYAGRKKLYLALAVLFVVPCIVWVFRTSIMGTTLALMTFFFFKYKLKSLPVIACILLLFILAVFFIPSVKEKMFNSKDTDVSQLQNNELSFDDINSNARFYMWETLMNKLYEDSMLTGSGTGAVQNYMYSNTVFGGLKAPHNDYVQILCDNGLIGLVLFLLAGFGAILHSFVEYNRRNVPASIKICAITAGSSMFGVLLTMLTDNTVNYSLATLAYPFGFYGMMLGLKKNKE
jgi:O-antigen ligase